MTTQHRKGNRPHDKPLPTLAKIPETFEASTSIEYIEDDAEYDLMVHEWYQMSWHQRRFLAAYAFCASISEAQQYSSMNKNWYWQKRKDPDGIFKKAAVTRRFGRDFVQARMMTEVHHKSMFAIDAILSDTGTSHDQKTEAMKLYLRLTGMISQVAKETANGTPAEPEEIDLTRRDL
jgi:hypothetical protein